MAIINPVIFWTPKELPKMLIKLFHIKKYATFCALVQTITVSQLSEYMFEDIHFMLYT